MTLAPAMTLLDDLTETDANLLAAASRGERAALGELARRYVHFVYAAAFRQTGDRHLAEDVTQAVFLTLWKKAGRIRPPALAAWLHQTTRYAAVNANRARRRRTHHEQAAARPEATMPYVLPEPDPLLPLLDDAIASLGGKDRQAVIGRYLRGQDVSAVANAIGITPAAAQKRLERAVVKLRGYFARHDVRGGAVTTAAVTAALTAAATTSAHAAPPTLAATVTSSASLAPAAKVAAGLAGLLATIPIKTTLATLAAVVIVGGTTYEVKRPASPSSAVQLRGASGGVGQVAASAEGTSISSATLRNGVSVDLIGVGENPSIGRPWWRIDGSPTDPPYALGNGRVFPGNDTRLAREFAYRVTQPKTPGPNGPADVRFEVMGGSESAGGTVIDRAGNTIPGVEGRAVNLPDQPADARFLIAAGPWKVVLAAPASGGVRGRVEGSSTRIDPPADVAAGNESAHVEVHVTQTDDDANEQGQRQLVIQTTNGRSIPTSAGHEDSSGNLRHLTFHVPGIKVADIQQIRLETRSYDQWIDFRDVSVHAGQKTTPVISTSDDGPVIGQLKDGSVSELVAIGEPIAGKWWTPAGRPTTRPAGVQDDPNTPPPAAGKRRVTVVTSSAARFGRLMTPDAPLRPGHTTITAMGSRNITAIEMDVDPTTTVANYRFSVASKSDLQATLQSNAGDVWDPSVELSEAGIKIVLSNAREINGHATFDELITFPGDWPADYTHGISFHRRDGKPLLKYGSASGSAKGQSIYTCACPLAELDSASITLTHYNESIVFKNVPLQPGPSTVAVETHEPAGR